MFSKKESYVVSVYLNTIEISSKEVFQKIESQNTPNDKINPKNDLKKTEIKPRFFTLVVKRGENHRFEAVQHKQKYLPLDINNQIEIEQNRLKYEQLFKLNNWIIPEPGQMDSQYLQTSETNNDIKLEEIKQEENIQQNQQQQEKLSKRSASTKRSGSTKRSQSVSKEGFKFDSGMPMVNFERYKTHQLFNVAGLLKDGFIQRPCTFSYQVNKQTLEKKYAVKKLELKIEYYETEHTQQMESTRVGYKLINLSDFIGKGLQTKTFRMDQDNNQYYFLTVSFIVQNPNEKKLQLQMIPSKSQTERNEHEQDIEVDLNKSDEINKEKTEMAQDDAEQQMNQEELYQQLKLSRETIYKLSKQLEQANKQIIYLKENIEQKNEENKQKDIIIKQLQLSNQQNY